MKARSFFDVYAQEYDIMTDAAAREKNHRREVRALIDKFKPQTVLDAGCATGLTSYLFADQGVPALGLDRSRVMIEQAQKKYRRLKLPLEFKCGLFEKLPQKLSGKFDMVVCLANAISGTGNTTNLLKALRNFYRVLTPGGTLVLQMLNHRALKENELFPIKATEKNGIVYIRFAERVGTKFTLFVARVDLKQKPVKLEPFRSVVDNFAVDTVAGSFGEAGFDKIKKYGNLMLDKKFSLKSRDLVLVGRKTKS